MDDAPVMSGVFRFHGCPFLSLPGELRNRIYDFCVEEGTVNLPASHTCFGNLRYVCKLLYTEYTPIYLATTVVILQAADINRYFAAFYPGLQPCNEIMPNEPTERVRASHDRGQIKIDIPVGATLGLRFFANLRSTKLHFTIVRGGCINRPLEDAGELLRAIMDPSCSIDFQESVEQILFRYSFQAEIVIKLHHGITFENLSDVMSDRSPRQWLVQQCLPALQHLKIVMESSEGVLRAPVETDMAQFRRSRGYIQLHPIEEPGGNNQQTSFEALRHPKAVLTSLSLALPRSPPRGFSALGSFSTPPIQSCTTHQNW